MAEIWEWDAVALTAALAAGEVSAEEAMAATLDRIADVNGAVNAVVAPRDRDDLLAEARTKDRGDRTGPLHGMPFAVKDVENAAGLPTSHGSPIYAGQVAAADGGVAARLRAAGALFIGKTNVPEFGLGSHSTNPVFGVTRNPYELSRTAGGSSGGAAAALAARMVPLADGSDAMGSLRNPAGWCNVWSLRPTWGVVPGDVGGETFLHFLSTAGPMARTPADLALLLGVMAGPEPRRPFGRALQDMPKPAELADGRAPGPQRIGWLADWGGAYAMAPGVLETCAKALELMEGLGCRVEPLAPPVPAARLWESWTTLRFFEKAGSHGADYDDPVRRAQLNPNMIWEIEHGHRLTAAEVRAASAVRSAWFATAVDLFDRFDVLALPTAQIWPFAAEGDWPEAIGARAMDTYHRWMEVVVPASLIGLPVLTAPAGFGPESGPGVGLPMGLQLIGAPGREAALLRLGAAYHAATRWPETQPPNLKGA